MKVLKGQVAAEVLLTLKRGESVLLSLGIPVVALVVFSKVHVLSTGSGRSVDFLVPGIISLAIMSSALVNLAIATGFERYYSILKRLGFTPLGRTRLVLSKIITLFVLELIQVVTLVVVALAIGWHLNYKSAHGSPGPLVVDLVVVTLAVLVSTAAFASLALFISGTMSAFFILGFANVLWFVLLLLSGILYPLSKLPHALGVVVRLLPSTALGQILRHYLDYPHLRHLSPVEPWTVLVFWSILGIYLASRYFRWDS